MDNKNTKRKLEELWENGVERAVERASTNQARNFELDQDRLGDAAGLVVKTRVRGGTSFACTWTCTYYCPPEG
ncbi:MAG TPA: hypothetical protein VFD70_10835 [Anaerolineae bacterium]|nr:hypothetical protein [Anaerolineae bacterium]